MSDKPIRMTLEIGGYATVIDLVSDPKAENLYSMIDDALQVLGQATPALTDNPPYSDLLGPDPKATIQKLLSLLEAGAGWNSPEYQEAAKLVSEPTSARPNAIDYVFDPSF